MEVSSHRHFCSKQRDFCVVISAPFVVFCTEKYPLHGLKPCKNRAETVHLLSDKQNRPIPHRLDGIGLSGRTARSVFLLAKNSLLPVELSGQTHEQEVPVYLSSALFSALLRYCRGLCPVAFAKRVEKLLASPKPTSRAISLTLWSVRTRSSFACVMRKLTR